MMAKKTTSKKTKQIYLREVSVKYRKRRVKSDAPVDEALNEPEKVVELFRDMQDETKEKLIAVSLDAKLKIINFEVVGVGIVSGVFARPAEALRAAIMVNAYGVILVHNHPSGDPTPSDEDKAFTKQIGRSCDDLGIKLHDHIIIGSDSFFSFDDEGLI